MQRVDVTEQDARDKVRWSQMIHCEKRTPKGSSPKKKKKSHSTTMGRLYCLATLFRRRKFRTYN